MVPEHVCPIDVLKLQVPAWCEIVIDEIFDDDDVPKKLFGKSLIPSAEMMRSLCTNALQRMLNCVPPDGISAWRSTGETDHNGFEIMKPNFHTCGCESWNSTQTAFCVGDNNTQELSTACHYEGYPHRGSNPGLVVGHLFCAHCSLTSRWFEPPSEATRGRSCARR